jgi:hypothetical protein
MVYALDYSKHRKADFSPHGISVNFDAFTLPKRLGFYKIQAMLDFVTRALGRVELEVYAVFLTNLSRRSSQKGIYKVCFQFARSDFLALPRLEARVSNAHQSRKGGLRKTVAVAMEKGPKGRKERHVYTKS